MSLKSISCTECRKHHRKCVRNTDSITCTRCSRLQLVCVLPSLDSEFDPNEAVDGSRQLKEMLSTVRLLEHTIQDVQVELECYKKKQGYGMISNMDTNVGKSGITQETYSWLDDTFSESGGSSTTSRSNKGSDNSTMDETMDQCDDTMMLITNNEAPNDRLLLSNGKEWKMTLKNGQWRIDTGINTLSGLDELYKILYRSPSPIQGIHINTPITIEACDLRTIFPFTVKLARNHLSFPTKLKQLFPTPPLLIQQPKWVVDRLVYMYLRCYNPSMTFVHKSTYLSHYQQLKNPLTCPVTMALCTYVCCGQHNYSSTNINDNVYYDDNGNEWFASMTDRRVMGEYFYRQCRNTLDDIFDEPHRRLETVMAINILKRFLMNTLRVSEMRKLETIAYLICVDLKSSYKVPDGSVEREMFARHYAFSIWCHVAVDFFMDSISSHDDLDFIRLAILPGESEFTWNFLELQNHFFDILLEPSVYIVYENVQHILLGNKVEMTLELILRFEHVTRKWWEDLPDHLRLCDNPWDFNNVKLIIQQTRDDTKLTLFIFFLDVVASFHYCLLKIQTRVNHGGDTMGIDKDVLAHIHGKSLKACLDFAEMMILCVNKLDTDVGYSQFLSDVFLFVAIDVLASLTFCNDPVVALEAKQKLAMCFSALDAADFMEGHRVPLASSPLTTKLMNSNATLFHLYNQYPQPRYALLYDICRFLSPLDSSPL